MGITDGRVSLLFRAGQRANPAGLGAVRISAKPPPWVIDVDRERLWAVALHPNRTGGSPASGFPVHGLDGLTQALDSRFWKSRTSRAGLQPRSSRNRGPHYFVRASLFRSQARQNRRPNRVHMSLCIETCYGLLVHFQLLSTRGYRPGAVTFSYWP